LVTEDQVRLMKWKVLGEDEYATSSDHELIKWEIFKELLLKTNNTEIHGWAILDLVNDEEEKESSSGMAKLYQQPTNS
jgi:hypothetical protein